MSFEGNRVAFALGERNEQVRRPKSLILRVGSLETNTYRRLRGHVLQSSIIPTDIKPKLLSYQIPHTEKLFNTLKKYSRALDASDTGTGKTYSAIAVAKTLKLKSLIICPKSVINSWKECIEHFNCDCYGISNYELIQNCKILSNK